MEVMWNNFIIHEQDIKKIRSKKKIVNLHYNISNDGLTNSYINLIIHSDD